MSAINASGPKQMQFQVEDHINYTPILKGIGLEQIAVSETSKALNQVAIIQNSETQYYSKNQVLKVAGEILGTLSSHYTTDESKIEACLKMIFKCGESIAKVKEKYESVQAPGKAKKKWSEAETNRMNTEGMLPTWNTIQKELSSRTVKLDAKRAEKLFENVNQYRSELGTTVPAEVRSETLAKYQKDINELYTLLKPQSDKEKELDKLYRLGKSIDFFLKQEKQEFDKYTKLLKTDEQRTPRTESAITRHYQLNEEIEKGNEEIAKLLDAKEQTETTLLKAHLVIREREDKIRSLSNAHAITPTDAKVLQCQSQFAVSRIKAAASQLKLNKTLEPVKENLLKGVIKSTSWGRNRKPEEVKAEVRTVIGTLLAQAIVLEDKKAWDEVNKMLNSLRTLEKGEYFPAETDPIRIAWENEGVRRAKIIKK